MSEEYEMYVHRMWINNCVERDSYSQDVYSKQEYIQRNAQFLKDNFDITEMGNDGKEYVHP